MNIIELLLSPFIFIIEQLFLFSYSLSGNYGVSIVLLSFWISLILLPIFVLIERAKKKDDALKLKMKPLVEEIKRCYKGQERYYYLKTLNRQHNYSQLRALIPTLSLLLQIPFFIAAYQFLEAYTPMKGIGFLFIKDLNTPDGLLGSINVLPVAMTLVNLVTAYFYTRNGNTSERRQMLIVAAIFLVLLFKLPAGLVLYWTMNNVFSFFRLFLTNPEVFKSQKISSEQPKYSIAPLKERLNLWLPKLKVIIAVFIIAGLVSQINWALTNTFDGFALRIAGIIAGSIAMTIIVGVVLVLIKTYESMLLNIVVKPQIFYALVFLIFYFLLAAKFYFTGPNSSLANLSFLILLPTQFISIIYVIRNKARLNGLVSKVLVYILIFVFLTQVLNLIVWIGGQKIIFEFKNISLLTENSKFADVVKPGLVFILLGLPFYLVQHKAQLSSPVKKSWLIYLLSILYIIGLVFLWHPLIVYSSSPETFDFPASRIISNNIGIFIKVFVPAVFLYLIFPRKIKNAVIVFILTIFLTAFIYSFVIPLNLGSLQESRFSEQERLALKTVYYIMEGLFLIGIFQLVKWIVSKKYTGIILGALITLNIFLPWQSLYLSISSGKFYKTDRDILVKSSQNDTKPLSFSKTKENLVYFVADGFQGWYIKKIMEEDPDLKNTLKGFVWYPNTVSISNYTHSSMPSMLGGSDYTVEKLNLIENKSIKEKWCDASHDFIEKAKSQGYTYSTEYIHYMHCNNEIIDNTFTYWDDSWKKYQEDIHLGIFHEIWYKRLYENAIFSCIPVFLKPKIYNNKKWLSHFSKVEIKEYSFKWYNFIRLLPYISNNGADEPNFIFIHNAAAHNPWNIVDDNGKVKANVSPYQNNKWYLQQLGKWIDWMQENEVYDNTKIILLSDHGPSWYQYDGKLEVNSPLTKDDAEPDKLSEKQFYRLNPLLLVKDFNSQEDFKEDWRLMTNADGTAIAFNENDPTRNDPANRKVEAYWTEWASKMIENNTMEVKSHFEISDNIFDLKNWKQK